MKYFSYRFFSLMLVVFVLSGCATRPSQVGNEDAKQLPKEEAENYALYAMMASNAYLDSERTYFPIEDLGWVRVDLNGKPTALNSYSPSTIWGTFFSNLQFDIWEHRNSNKTVISFKGTDEKIDWTANLSVGPSIQYKSAKKHVEDYIEKHRGRTVVVTGHSLGGGLALSSSLWLRVDAYVFNPSPRVFDGWKDKKEPAIRKVIYQEGEILSKVRSFWPKFIEVINEEDIYQTSFNYNGENNHRADYLAEGLLRCSINNQQLSELAKKIVPIKVSCNM